MARFQRYRRPVSINPLSNRACGFPAHGLTTIFLMWRARRPFPCSIRLGPLKHLSADNMTWLQRSPVVAARWFAPLSFKGFRDSARRGRISPFGWSLRPGAPALTRTGLSPARTTRLSGRTIYPLYGGEGWGGTGFTAEVRRTRRKAQSPMPVSYTHLTLPTNREV